jgi:hypothetical protein
MGLFSKIGKVAKGAFGGLTGAGGYKAGAETIGRSVDELKALYQPWTQFGTAALSRLSPESMAGFTGSPGLQFQMGEGLRGVERTLAARGMKSSGNELLELQRVGQGMAMQDYEQEWQRRMAEAQLGGGMMQSLGSAITGGAQAQAGMQGQAGAATAGFLQDIIGTGAGMFAGSDINLKTDIKKLGQLTPHIGWYEFSYKADPTHTLHEGVMAQEVEQIIPAVVLMKDGYKAVNYGLLFKVLS